MANRKFADGYEDYRQASEHGYNTGTVVAPSSSRTGKPRIVRTGGAFSTRILTFEATRNRLPPAIPDARDLVNDTLVSAEVTVALPTANVKDGSLSFHAQGRYIYLSTNVRKPGEDVLPSGAYPFSLGSVDLMASEVLNTVPLPPILNQEGVADAVAQSQYATSEPVLGWFLLSYPAQSTFTFPV